MLEGIKILVDTTVLEICGKPKFWKNWGLVPGSARCGATAVMATGTWLAHAGGNINEKAKRCK